MGKRERSRVKRVMLFLVYLFIVMGFGTCSLYIFKKQINKNREGTWNTNRKEINNTTH